MVQDYKERVWRRRELALELEQLRREKQHLKSVGIERPLTVWERLRLLELVTDFRRVNTDLKNLSYI